MTHEDLRRWIATYERAWRAAGTDLLDALFAPTATYLAGPYAPALGRGDLPAFWEGEREGPSEPFTMTWSPVAIEGDTAVARIEVDYAGPPPRQYRDLWIITLDTEGRCTAFEEWPFFAGQPLSFDEL